VSFRLCPHVGLVMVMTLHLSFLVIYCSKALYMRLLSNIVRYMSFRLRLRVGLVIVTDNLIKMLTLPANQGLYISHFY
jgi:hypothetical protein